MTLARPTLLALAASLASLAAHAAPEGAPKPLALGSPMPSAEVRMEGTDGKEVTLGGAAGRKGTLVIFTCNHCPYVKAWDDRIAAIGNRARRAGMGVVAVNANDPAKVPQDGLDAMKARAKEKKLRYPYVVDATSNVARAFGASRTPEAFLFARDGKLAYHGAVDDNAEDAAAVQARWLEDAVNAVLEGRAPDPAETKAVGCSIKFRAPPETTGGAQ